MLPDAAHVADTLAVLADLLAVLRAVPAATLVAACLALALDPGDRSATWAALVSAEDRRAATLRRLPRNGRALPARARPAVTLAYPLTVRRAGVRAYVEGRAAGMDRRRAALLRLARGMPAYGHG